MDIIEVLGYANNLVEQDGVKVLLVANEEEIIKYEAGNRIICQQQKDEIVEEQELQAAFELPTNTNTNVIKSQTSENHLRIKEKTISDTIQFEEDYSKAIEDIIRLFDNSTLVKFADSDSIKCILDTMKGCGTSNLQLFYTKSH